MVSSQLSIFVLFSQNHHLGTLLKNVFTGRTVKTHSCQQLRTTLGWIRKHDKNRQNEGIWNSGTDHVAKFPGQDGSSVGQKAASDSACVLFLLQMSVGRARYPLLLFVKNQAPTGLFALQVGWD